MRLAVRHEVVHQFLWRHCRPASTDRLFHEAMAVALSGEAALWREDPYVSGPQAIAALSTSTLDTPAARRALARLVTEESHDLPRPLRARLSRCVDDAPWNQLSVQELAGEAQQPLQDALVVLHAQSGEVLETRGAVDALQPVGSTLKPFVVAAAAAAAAAAGTSLPVFAPRPTDPQWACGRDLPSRVDAGVALVRSCNGWFLAFEAAHKKNAVELGALGEVLLALGLSRLPQDMSEAIGLRTGLVWSARGLAEAWRLLVHATPSPGTLDVLQVLQGRGTLAGAPGLQGLSGMAAKTGTVRDALSRPRLGLLVASDDALVIVRVRAGRQGRDLVQDVVDARRRHLGRAQETVPVQVFGLLQAQEVTARCDGIATLVDAIPRLTSATTLAALVALVAPSGRAVCARGTWRVRPQQGKSDRSYAGVFVKSASLSSKTSQPSSPLSSSSPRATTTARQRAARQGSEIVFFTRRARYVAGVLQAEDATLVGEARVALARVIDHDVDHGSSRHPDRPVCDTTHCMTFLGTPEGAIDPAVVAALQRSLAQSGYSSWLPFSQGGSTPWQKERAHEDVVAAVGEVTSLVLKKSDVGPVVVVVHPERVGEAWVDEVEAMSCERLRGPLRLPSCPVRAERRGPVWTFWGTGAGHGLGLDVERARQRAREGASADTIVREAYGAPALPEQNQRVLP
jgi:hypothetical protein